MFFLNMKEEHEKRKGKEKKRREGKGWGGRGGEEGKVSLSTVFSIWALTGRINPVSSLNLISFTWFHELPKLLD